MFGLTRNLNIARRFARDERGNYAMIFGLAIIPIMGLVGAAVDYTTAARTRAQLQEALDGAAVAGARSVGRPPAEIIQTATNYARANLPAHLQSIPLTVDLLNDNTTVRIRPTAPISVPTMILPVVGIGSVNVTVTSEATNGYQDIEIALALDNTGSMSGQKINLLRTAVTNFINSMEQLSASTGRPNAVRLGIVPFDRFVNMGTSFRNQTWMNFTTYGVNPNTWEGCVTDRNQQNDVSDTAPATGQPNTHFHAVANSQQTPCGLEPVLDLTDNWVALRRTASRMRASGNTNVTIGLAHGWHMLTANQPYTTAAAPRDRLTKVLIMLTDGDNTQNRWTTNGNSIDARTAAICSNIKATGILIYTIRVINGDANLLRNCATSPSMYYNVTAADQMNAVFQAIAAQMSALRLSR
jgi:Flp pilus assembly protein TadG